MSVTDTIIQHWRSSRKIKSTTSGWLSSNAICCEHNGHTSDTRSRSGIHTTNEGGVVYSCFNCGFKAAYYPGSKLSRKMRNLLEWMGMNSTLINQLSLDAMRVESDEKLLSSFLLPNFTIKSLPDDSIKLTTDLITDQTIPALEYIYNRGLTVDLYDFYVSNELKNRIIIPFEYQHNIVGYTARTLTNSTPRFISKQDQNFVFNLNRQSYHKKYVLVLEGPFDAISVGGVALLGSNITDIHNRLIKQLNQQIVLVPDRDKNGQNMMKQALDYGWSISLPNWDHDLKDVNDAVKKYGRLAAMYQIFNSIESNPTKIYILAKQFFKGI